VRGTKLQFQTERKAGFKVGSHKTVKKSRTSVHRHWRAIGKEKKRRLNACANLEAEDSAGVIKKFKRKKKRYSHGTVGRRVMTVKEASMGEGGGQASAKGKRE